jgi:hypothetical protein
MNDPDGDSDISDAPARARLGARLHAGATLVAAYASNAVRCELRLFEGASPRTLPMDPQGDGYSPVRCRAWEPRLARRDDTSIHRRRMCYGR